MKILESAEDYLEQILMISNEKGNCKAIDIVHQLNYSKASVSVAMKKLSENGYISVSAHGYITLTPEGNEIATRIYERHTVLTSILVKLGVSEYQAAIDACKLEHNLSNDSFEKIKNYYNEKMKEEN
jgi:Mn-dependent DtxR family transcriptional regulator